MNVNPNIGLSHVIDESTAIVHSTVFGRKSFGRIADLLCAWAIEEHQLRGAECGGLRMLASALLESLPESQGTPTRIELSIFNGQILIAVRMEWSLEVEAGAAEKIFTQHWLNSPQMQVLRRAVDPKDRIEVRYHSKTKLVEWRVIRSLGAAEIDPEVSSFLVVEDDRENLEETGPRYRDLGDLPFQDWLQDAYRIARQNSASGEIRIQGEALQSDLEYARIKVSSELDEIEASVVRGRGQVEEESATGESELSGLKLIDDLIRNLQKKELLEGELEFTIDHLRTEARDRKKEITQWKRKYQQVVELLNRKEMALYTQANEMRANEKKAMQQARASESSSENESTRVFREKAIQMFEKLKAVTEQNERLKKDILALKERTVAQGSELKSSIATRASTEELEKKLDRVQRSLDAEKAKTSALLERALNAEKDSQSSAHLITDLEAKVEHSLKTTIQYKKEIESMKQKMVQSDAEKNKVKNDLLKAQAQIQTLMKRQAA